MCDIQLAYCRQGRYSCIQSQPCIYVDCSIFCNWLVLKDVYEVNMTLNARKSTCLRSRRPTQI